MKNLVPIAVAIGFILSLGGCEETTTSPFSVTVDGKVYNGVREYTTSSSSSYERYVISVNGSPVTCPALLWCQTYVREELKRQKEAQAGKPATATSQTAAPKESTRGD